MNLQRKSAVQLATSGACALLVIAIAGCGKKTPPIAPVTGTVTFEGKRLPDRALIHFASESGFASRNEVQPDGTFLLGCEYGKGIPPGKYLVSISPPIPSPADIKDPVDPKYEYIPKRYRDFPTSGFSAEVVAGAKNDFHFNMKR
jgi:hypothetical protein